MYHEVFSVICVTYIYVPIRPGRQDPEADDIEDAED